MPREEQPVLPERAEELAAVDAAIAAAAGGTGRLMMIEGAPGIGKTSIVVEARAPLCIGFDVVAGIYLLAAF